MHNDAIFDLVGLYGLLKLGFHIRSLVQRSVVDKGNITDSNNYRHIALATIVSKLLNYLYFN